MEENKAKEIITQLKRIADILEKSKKKEEIVMICEMRQLGEKDITTGKEYKGELLEGEFPKFKFFDNKGHLRQISIHHFRKKIEESC